MIRLKQSQNRMACTMVILCLFSCIIQPTNSHKQRLWTTRDGTTQDIDISYLELNGSQSIQLPLSENVNNQQPLLDYTILLWFKPTSIQTFSYLFQFTTSLECYFTSSSTSRQLICDSLKKSNKLQVDTASVLQGQWTHLSLVGMAPSQASNVIGQINVGTNGTQNYNNRGASAMRVEQNQRVIGEDRSEEYVKMLFKEGWEVCIGGCSGNSPGSSGFKGGVREFRVINQYMTLDNASRLKNHYLLFDSKILGYYRFNSKNLMKDEYTFRFARTSNQSEVLTPKIDHMPNDICFPVTELATSLLIGDSSKMELQPLVIDDRWNPSEQGWGFTLSLWINANENTCFALRPQEGKSSCHLFMLQDVFMLYLSGKNSLNAYFFNSKIALESISKSLFIPQNQWVNIQLGVNQYYGYELRTYDVQGRLIGMVADSKELYSLRALNQKTISLLKNYQGFVRSLIFLTERKALPIFKPKDQYYNNLKCLAYFVFEESSVVSFNSTQEAAVIMNYCKNANRAQLNIALRTTEITDIFQQTFYKEASYGQTENSRGFITSGESLFDGIACEDGQKVYEFKGKGSYARGYIYPLVQNSTSSFQITVEFWFKMSQLIPVSEFNSYFFSLNDTLSGNEYFSIYQEDKTGFIQCQPYGPNSQYQQTIRFADYTIDAQFSSEASGWAHIACILDTDKGVSGYFHMRNAFENAVQAQGADAQLVFPSSNMFKMVIGNSNKLTNGTKGLRLKDIRMWNTARSADEIKLWRYRQVDPRDTKGMLTNYFRLDEGFQSYFNYVSITRVNSPVPIEASQVEMVQDSAILICPLGTYYSTDYKKCYSNPIAQVAAAIYPIYNPAQDQVSWKFDLSNSMLLNKDFQNSLSVQWSFEDQIVQSITESLSKSTTFTVPAFAFRENAQYRLKAHLLDNNDSPMQTLAELTFVPLSCQYFLVNNMSVESEYNDYNTQQSTEDIKFTLNLVQLRPYCQEIAFFKDVVPTGLTYQMVTNEETHFMGNQKVNLQYTWDQEKKQFNVVLPKREQYKIPLNTDINFIFNIGWQNSEYKEVFPSQNLTFQNAKYTINFRKEGSALIPDLFIEQPMILGGDDAIFNASRTYLTYKNESNKQDGIKFNWVCPTGLENLCLGKFGPILNISGTEFKEAQGQFNMTYTIILNIEWLNDVNGQSVLETAQLSVEAIWYDVTVPSFYIEIPSGGVKVTSDNNRFGIILNNYEIPDLSLLDVVWSIVPNASVSKLPLTMNNTLLTLPKGAFAVLTSYTLTVSIQHKQYSFAKKEQTYRFATSQPPYGGSVIIDPTQGFIGNTTFTVKLSNWDSSNKPIKYQVWSSQDAGGETASKQLTPNWLIDSSAFNFQAVNSNPLIVLIRDEYGEQIKKKLVVMITVRAQDTDWGIQAKSVLQSLIAPKNDRDTNDRLNKMQSYIEFAVSKALDTTSAYSDSNIPSSGSSNSSNDEQVSNQTNTTDGVIIVLDQLYEDIKQLSNQTLSIEDKLGIAQKSVKMLGQISNSTALSTNETIANKTLMSLSLVFESCNQDEQLRIQLFTNEEGDISQNGFIQDVQLTLSGLMNISIQSNFTNQTKSRLLQTTDSEISEPVPSDNSTNNTTLSESNSTESSNTTSESNSTETNNTTSENNSTETNNTLPVDNNNQTTPSTDNDTTVPNDQPNNQTVDNQTQVNLDDILIVKDFFINMICSTLRADAAQVKLSSPSFDAILDKISAQNQAELRSHIYFGDFKTRTTYQLQQILTSVKQQSSSIESVCIVTNFYKNSMFSNNSTKLSNVLSQSQVSYYPQVEQTIQIDLQGMMTSLYDNVVSVTAMNNTNQTSQIKCKAYSKEREIWDQELCQTTIIENENHIQCSCNQQDNMMQGVFTEDPSIIPEKKPENKPEVIFIHPYKINSSYSFIAICLTLGVLTLCIPAMAYCLDNRDFKQADSIQQQFTTYQKRFHTKITELQPTLKYWYVKYPLKVTPEGPKFESLPKLNFTTVVHLCHPVISLISIFEGFEHTRLVKAVSWMIQSAVYTIVIIMMRDYWYPIASKSESIIQQEDAIQIIKIGLIAMGCLLPVPYLNSVIRTLSMPEIHKGNKVSERSNPKNKNEQERNPQLNSIREQVSNRGDTFGPNEAIQTDHPMQNSHESDVSSVPVKLSGIQQLQEGKAKGFSILFIIIAVGLNLAAIVLSAYYLRQSSKSLQYCVISSFYLGLFGSLLFLYFVYSFYQYLVVLLFYRANLHSDKQSAIFLILADISILCFIDDISYLHKACFGDQLATISQSKSLIDISYNNDSSRPAPTRVLCLSESNEQGRNNNHENMEEQSHSQDVSGSALKKRGIDNDNSSHDEHAEETDIQNVQHRKSSLFEVGSSLSSQKPSAINRFNTQKAAKNGGSVMKMRTAVGEHDDSQQQMPSSSRLGEDFIPGDEDDQAHIFDHKNILHTSNNKHAESASKAVNLPAIDAFNDTFQQNSHHKKSIDNKAFSPQDNSPNFKQMQQSESKKNLNRPKTSTQPRTQTPLDKPEVAPLNQANWFSNNPSVSSIEKASKSSMKSSGVSQAQKIINPTQFSSVPKQHLQQIDFNHVEDDEDDHISAGVHSNIQESNIIHYEDQEKHKHNDSLFE